MQYSWLSDTRRAFHCRKMALSSVMSFYPSYLSHAASVSVFLTKLIFAWAFWLGPGILREKPRGHIQSWGRVCPPDDNTQATSATGPFFPVGIFSKAFQQGFGTELSSSDTTASSDHSQARVLVCVPMRLGNGHFSTVWSIFSSCKSGSELNTPPVRFGFV